MTDHYLTPEHSAAYDTVDALRPETALLHWDTFLREHSPNLSAPLFENPMSILDTQYGPFIGQLFRRLLREGLYRYNITNQTWEIPND